MTEIIQGILIAEGIILDIILIVAAALAIIKAFIPRWHERQFVEPGGD
jgi:hypothetical protein